MCGIIGITEGGREPLIQGGLSVLKHRGPDDDGIFSDGNITFGHCRLSIIDLSPLGHQPMKDEMGDFILSFNGEIYNFKELKKDLEDKGVIFSSESDTEVILRGFMLEGKNFFEKLRGMWAFALYDKKNGQLVLSRDYFGVKPLYYAVEDNSLCFASELGAMKKILSSVGPNTEAYYLFYNLGYFPGKETCYREVKKVLPGEVLVWDIGSKRIENTGFLALPPQEKHSPDLSFEEAVKEMKKVFEQSIEAHYVSDVPVSILLSGGVDSSLIAAISKKIGKKPIAYHIAIPGSIDTKYARGVARHLGLDFVEKEFNSTTLKKNYEEVLDWLDSPTSDVSIIPTSMVYKAIYGESKVVLSGEGGDELFGGYLRHVFLSSFEKMESPQSSFLDRFYGASFLSISLINPLLDKVKRYLAKNSGDLVSAYLQLVKTGTFPIEAKKTKEYILDFYQKHPYKNLVPVNLFFDMYMYLPDSLMYKNDMASMHSSIEARVPFVDREVVVKASTLPFRFRLSEQYSQKAVMKKVLSDFLPQELIDRPKKGFGFSFSNAKFFEEDYRQAAEFHRNHATEFGISPQMREFISKTNGLIICKKFPRFAFSLITNWKIFT